MASTTRGSFKQILNSKKLENSMQKSETSSNEYVNI